MIDRLSEKDEALIIDNATWTRYSDATDNAKTEISITSQTGAVLMGDFTPWGEGKIIPAIVKYTDNSYDSVLIKSFTTTQATAELPFTKTVTKISNMHDVKLGQHLTDMGCKAMGENLFKFPKRQAFKQTLVQGCNFLTHTESNLGTEKVLINTDTLKEELRWKVLNSFSPYFFTINGQTLDFYEISSRPFTNASVSATAEQGIEIIHNFNYIGFSEIYIGTDTRNSVGGAKVRLINKDTNAVISEFYVLGSTKRIIFEHGIGNYAIQIVVSDSVNTKIFISGIYFWKKRIVNSPIIWDKNDVVLFVTDSWGSFPETIIEEEKIPMFDGYLQMGKCFMPFGFRDLFVAMGGKASNVKLATRGGFTSEWAVYWINHFIEKTNPTKIVFHFSINDNISTGYVGSVDSPFDFDPVNIWSSKSVSAGGIKGAITEAQFVENIKILKDTCIRKGITPIFFSPPKTASPSQSQTLGTINLKYFAKGIK